ncbi:MAG: PIN domain-containing protein [candidate division KSB1 bacterium]|nr:PIN domain-containing protein [candidate division KSB1 bacterium]MDZ7301620.1 PIN domain-containing protein [candidate division KSB1 bacterium]MDZ7310964.1 PIN domain-containing protein [candidate division KSB1 bacterium]
MDSLNEVFLDAAYAIALAAPSDQYHERAKALAEQLEADETRLITTRAVALEIGNALAKQRYREAAIELLEALEEDANVEIVPLSENLYMRAFQLYRERLDKEWGLTDCISFVVMKDRGLMKALTMDEHFKQAGFHALLL